MSVVLIKFYFRSEFSKTNIAPKLDFHVIFVHVVGKNLFAIERFSTKVTRHFLQNMAKSEMLVQGFPIFDNLSTDMTLCIVLECNV